MPSLILHGIAVYSFPQTQLVLNALPSKRVDSSADGCENLELDESRQNEFRVLISKVDGEYVWESREKRRLIHVESGAFHYFIDPRGSGYVKVFDQELIPDFLRTDPKARFVYFEHLSLWLTTITYWGTADNFEP